jgi:Fe-S cluster biogenesis protein NfuA
MYIVKVEGDEVHIHLAGSCAGCPGSSMTRDEIIAPVLRTAIPKLRLTVTTGWRVPEGASKVA